MVIQDKQVDEYVLNDITEIDMKKLSEDRTKIKNSDYSDEIQLILQYKLMFRDNFADHMSLIKLNYMLHVLHTVHDGKATISDPDAFKDKIKSIEKAAALKGQELTRANSGFSGSSAFGGGGGNRSQMTSENGETRGS